jgi:hypothetical protein
MGQKSSPRAQTAKGAPCLGTTDIIAAITITGDAVCRSTKVVYVSTPESARDFLPEFVACPSEGLRRVGAPSHLHSETRKSISEIVWFPPRSIAWTSSLCFLPRCTNSGGIWMLVTFAGRSALNTRSGRSFSTIAR